MGSENSNTSITPKTAIMVGAGCSIGLGIPPMTSFMDEIFVRLPNYAIRLKDTNIKEEIYSITDTLKLFTKFIKGSAAAIETNFLNVEELYGLSEMVNELDLKEHKSDFDDLVEKFNKALMYICIEAGGELLDDEYKTIAENIDTIKRESQTEDPGTFKNRGSKHSNLLAYLGLASFNDEEAGRTTYPLIIQMNWDLAYDRALYTVLNSKNRQTDAEGYHVNDIPWIKRYEGKERTTMDHDFKNYPLMVRPHGGLYFAQKPTQERTSQDRNDKKCLNWNGLPIIEESATKKESNGENGQVCLYPEAVEEWRYILTRPDKQRIEQLNKWSKYMTITPPTWKKDVRRFQNQWRLMMNYFKDIRRLIIIGYSMPPSDLYMKHFLALVMAESSYVPKVYVWNTSMVENSDTFKNYCDTFRPLVKLGRLYAMSKPFGDPALFDLERMCYLSEQVKF